MTAVSKKRKSKTKNRCGGNYIIIDKEYDLVVITRWMDDSKVTEMLSLFIKSIEVK